VGNSTEGPKTSGGQAVLVRDKPILPDVETLRGHLDNGTHGSPRGEVVRGKAQPKWKEGETQLEAEVPRGERRHREGDATSGRGKALEREIPGEHRGVPITVETPREANGLTHGAKP
jgi:hypothetical protein